MRYHLPTNITKNWFLKFDITATLVEISIIYCILIEIKDVYRQVSLRNTWLDKKNIEENIKWQPRPKRVNQTFYDMALCYVWCRVPQMIKSVLAENQIWNFSYGFSNLGFHFRFLLPGEIFEV